MGWFSREELPPEVTVVATPEQLAQLTLDLNNAWDFGMSEIGYAFTGLPLRVLWSEKSELFRVTIPGEYVKALNRYIPSATVGERYGNAYST